MIGSLFTLKNVDGSVMESFTVKFHEINIVPERTFPDGSYSPERSENLVSKNGNSWYCVGGPMRIVTSST